MNAPKDCTILRSERLIPYGHSLVLDVGDLLEDASPGQFVMLSCDGHFLRRPLGICEAEAGRLRVIIEPKGQGTQALIKKQAREQISVLGPLGHGFDLSGQRILLVGGGFGAAPLLFAAKRCPGTAHAILGFKSAGTALLIDAFRAVCPQVDIATEDGTMGEEGLVEVPLRRILAEIRYDRILTCGPKLMMESVSAVAEEHGIPCQVSMEERMGCGVGACLVCVCKTKDGDYRRVCHDGPVFDAQEVLFHG